MKRLNFNILQVFILVFCVTFFVGCEKDESINSIDNEKSNHLTNDTRPKFIRDDDVFVLTDTNSLLHYRNGSLLFERKKVISDEIILNEYEDSDGYSVIKITPDSQSDDKLIVRKKSYSNGLYVFDLINPDGKNIYDLEFHTSEKSCPWCFVGPLVPVLSDIVDALDDTQAEDCAEAAVLSCGEGNVESFESVEPVDGGLFAGGSPGRCKITCKDDE
ncbi:MAG: hypothetical protein ACQESK_06055 [Bacteroidota bacterium]